MSARVCAVTRLLLDVMSDIGPKRPIDATASELDLMQLLLPLSEQLAAINQQSVIEMAEQVVRTLDA